MTPMHPLLLLFVAVSVATTALNLLLGARQGAYVRRHRATVPADFAATVSLAEHQRAADYAGTRLRLGAVEAVFGLLVALAWAMFGYDALYGLVASRLPPGLTRGVASWSPPARCRGRWRCRGRCCTRSASSSASASTAPHRRASRSTG